MDICPDGILRVVLRCMLHNPPTFLRNLNLKTQPTAMLPKNMVDTPPEESILFPLDDGKDLFFRFLVVFLLGCQ
jgi:hypothetical protein